MQVMSILRPSPGQSRKNHLIHLILLLGRVAFVIRLCRFVFLDGYRHVRARGLLRSVMELYSSLKSVCTSSFLAVPPRCFILDVGDPGCEMDCGVLWSTLVDIDFDQMAVRLMLSLPSSRAKIASEMAKTRTQLREKLVPTTYPSGITLTKTRSIPEQGRDRAWMENEWRNLKNLEGGNVVAGQVSGTVYHVSSKHHLEFRTIRPGSVL